MTDQIRETTGLPIVREGQDSQKGDYIVVCYLGFDCLIYSPDSDKPVLADGPECRGGHTVIGRCTNPAVEKMLREIVQNARKVWAQEGAVMDEYRQSFNEDLAYSRKRRGNNW